MTEDVFLGLGDKDPSSAHCEAMVVRVQCPRHRLEDIELDVKSHKLLLQSSSLCVRPASPVAPATRQLTTGRVTLAGSSCCTCRTL